MWAEMPIASWNHGVYHLPTNAVVHNAHLQIAQLAVQVMFSTHFVGCFFYWASAFNTTDSASHWYLNRASHIAGDLASHYVAAVYWAMTTVSISALRIGSDTPSTPC